MKSVSEQVPELLAFLYLRLNGFFTTGLVLQSEESGHADGDIDCLGIRFPFHDQREREVASDPLLGLGNSIDLLICEVKSSAPASFNKRLRTDLSTVDQMIRWCGFVPKEELKNAIQAVSDLLQEGVPKEMASKGVTIAGVRIRPLFLCPSCAIHESNDQWIIYGEQMIAYIAKCLDVSANREACSTQYSYDLWGRTLEPVVSYFKELPRGNSPSFKELRTHAVKHQTSELKRLGFKA